MLLGLNDIDLVERLRNSKAYYFYKGACQSELDAVTDPTMLGQTWNLDQDLDYKPTMEIRNKVKPLLKKQARFMFGLPPTMCFKALDEVNAPRVEDLRKFIDKILNSNGFWSNTQKAFLSSTITKRVLLRIEANPLKPIKIFYHDSTDFAYTLDVNDYREISKVTLVYQNSSTLNLEAKLQIWYKYEYYMENGECMLKLTTYNGVEDIERTATSEIIETKLSTLPGKVILNGGMLGDTIGESDLEDLIPMQDQYNRKISDFADALRFQMFGETVITDATTNSVNDSTIAPNSVMALVSLPGKSASAHRMESTFSGASAADSYLDRLDKDMHDELSMPRALDLSAVASAKSIKFMYADLVARCEEKWHDWDPALKDLISMIIESCSKFNCYKEWNHDWDNLDFNIVFKHNYPVPEDENDKKTMALAEVAGNTKSHEDYIRDFTDTEDAKGEWDKILQEIGAIVNAQSDQFLQK